MPFFIFRWVKASLLSWGNSSIEDIEDGDALATVYAYLGLYADPNLSLSLA